MGDIDLNLLLQRWGPWFLAGFMILRDLLPFLRDKIFPQVMQERKEENDRRWLLSERQVQAHEAIAQSVQQTTVLLATIDARSEVTALGIQRVEVAVTEINTRSRAQETKPTPSALPGKKVKRE